MIIVKSNTYHRPLLIVADSLLTLIVSIADTEKTGGQYLKSSVHEIAKGASALEEYQVHTVNSVLVNDISEEWRGYDVKQNKEVDTKGL